MVRAVTALLAIAACNGGRGASTETRDARSPPVNVTPPRDAAPDDRTLILTLASRRVVDKVPAHAGEVWKTVVDAVVDRARATQLAQALAQGDTTVREHSTRIAVSRGVAQSFVVPMGDDHRLLVQLDGGWQLDLDGAFVADGAGGWKADERERIALMGLRVQSGDTPDVGSAAYNGVVEPGRWTSVAVPIGGVFVVSVQKVMTNQVAYTEVLEIDVESLTTDVPADAMRAPAETPEALAAAWSAWIPIVTERLP